jgi:hypothetical protein
LSRIHGEAGRRSKAKAITAGLAVITTSVLVALLYTSAAARHAREVNVDRGRTDQSAYMGYARALAESGYTYVGDRNRMPLYPILQSLAYDPSSTPEEWFVNGKNLNIALSVVCLLGLLAIVRRYLPAPASGSLVLIVAFTVFVFKAGYIQAEVLFYTLNFCSYLLMSRLVYHPNWKWGLLAGVTLGLSHLTKASVIPGVAVFFGVGALKLLHELRIGRQGRPAHAGRYAYGEQLRNHITTWASVVLAFLLIVGPYLLNSRRVYGQYFYNVNSTFYVWYDSWEEVKQGTRAYGDRYGWPDMPPEMIPTLRRYVSEHTPGEIAGRITNGLEVLLREATESYGYFKYEVAYLSFALVLAVVCYRHTLDFMRRYRFLWIFNGVYFGAYVLLYAWFTPIAAGNRLPLAQFMPLMFGLSVVIYRLYAGVALVTWRQRSIELTRVFTVAVLLLLAYDVYEVVTRRIVSLYGGS